MSIAKKYIIKNISTVIATMVFTAVAVTTMHFSESSADTLYEYSEYSAQATKAPTKAYKPNSRSSYSRNNEIDSDSGFELIDRNVFRATPSTNSTGGQHTAIHTQHFNQPIYTNSKAKTSVTSGQSASSATGMEMYALASSRQSSNTSQSIGTRMKLRSSTSAYVPFEDVGPQKSPNGTLGWGDDLYPDPGGDPEGPPIPVGDGMLILLLFSVAYIIYRCKTSIVS